jgi:hypothetical protein
MVKGAPANGRRSRGEQGEKEPYLAPSRGLLQEGSVETIKRGVLKLSGGECIENIERD